jgi:uncharacterized protein HemY
MRMHYTNGGGNAMMAAAGILLSAVMVSVAALAQEPSPAQRAFEAGRYQEVVDAASAAPSPSVLFLAALSAQKLNDATRANAFLDQLAQRPDTDPWHFVGLSARQLLASDDQAALESAQRATALDPMLPEARY